MLKIGLSSCCGFPMTVEGLSELKAAGIEAIEYCGGKDINNFDFKNARAVCDKVGITLWSVHSHMRPDFDISSLEKECNDAAVSELSDLINRMSEVGIDKVVIHPTHTIEPFDHSTRVEKIKHTMACLDTLAEYAYKKGVYLAVENLPRTCLGNTIDEHLTILSANDKLRVCLDFNHSLIDDTAEFIKKVGDRIITVHVSDRDNINERHWLPGEGVLDWKANIDALASVGYKGVWMYEMGLDCPITIDRRQLTYKDFVVNANNIFARKPLESIGKPKPNLGLWGPQ